MNVLAGALAVVFGAIHGGPAIGRLRAPVAARGAGDAGAIPMWARSLWLMLSLVSIVGGALLIASDDMSGAVIAAIGCIGLWLLAIANGSWIHGRPNLVHHVVRGVMVAAIVALAFAGTA